MTSALHPDILFRVLLQKPGGRSARRNCLTKLQEICTRHHESGSRDFSLPVIGKQLEAEGIIKARSLYNIQSADYKSLIESWALFSGAQSVPESLRNNSGALPADEPKPRHRIARNYVSPISNVKSVSRNDEIVSGLQLRIKYLEAELAILNDKFKVASAEYVAPANQTRGRPLKNIERWELNAEDKLAMKKAIDLKFLDRMY